MATITFNLATDDYIDFIGRIRDWAKDPNRFSHGRPVLPYPPQNISQSEYADLELKAKDSKKKVVRTLIAKIRRHDLYIIGYKMEGAVDFLEFKWDKEGKIKYITGSTSLGFGENYSNLGQLHSLPNVGYGTLEDAIVTLATSNDGELRKPQVRALAVMIPEVVRFEKMSKELTSPMKKKINIKFKTWMEMLIYSWTPLSDMLLREDQFAIGFRLPKKSDGSANDLSTDSNLLIVTSGDAAQCVHLLKGNYPKTAALAKRNALLRGIAEVAAVVGEGISLVEIFAVRVTNIAGMNPGSLYGNIEIFDGLGSSLLYSLQKDESESIRPNDIAGLTVGTFTPTLTGPYRGVSGSQFFKLTLDLKNKKTSSDDEVSKGSFEWDLCELTNNYYYDTRLTTTVTGTKGSVTIYYTPFSNAIQASVEVVLVSGGGQNPVDIQGSIFGQYSNFSYSTDEENKYYRTAIFSKPANKVSVGSKIPLSRSVVAVPTSGSLIIEANMTSANGSEIAKGTANFQPQMSGTPVSNEITGKNGRIRVTVTWSAQISE